MSEQGNAPVEQSVEPVATPEVEAQKRDSVSLDTHKKLLDEKKKLQRELEDYRSKEREKQEEEARKRGDFEALIKSREEELAKERERRTSLEQTLVAARKMNAVVEALGGNVDPRWFKLIDTSSVVVNPETGDVDAMTVARVAESLKREFPEMVRPVSRLPAEAPQGSGVGTIAYEEWKKLPLAEMKKYKQSQIIY